MNADRCNFNSYANPFVNGTDGREAYPKHWVAILVHTYCEKRVAAHFDKLGIENYLPIQQEAHQWSDRKKKIDRVVIPTVVFVRLACNEVDEFRKLPFILKFTTCPGSKELATPIPDKQIEKLKLHLRNTDAKVPIVENLKAGGKVCFATGSMNGLEGELSHIEKNTSVVAIRIDGLGYACVRVEKVNLELI